MSRSVPSLKPGRRPPVTRLLPALAACLLTAGGLRAQLASAEPTPVADAHALVRVEVASPADADTLAALGIDLLCGSHVVSEDGRLRDVVVGPRERAALDAAGLAYDVRIPDLTAHLAERAAAWSAADAPPPALGAGLTPPFGQGSLAGMYTWAEVGSVLDQLTAAHPSITTDKVSLGTTFEGRSIWMVKVSDNPDVDEAEPEVRIDAMHHAREPQSMMSVIWFLSWLLEGYGSDPLATWLVDERELYVIPVVNPDGYVFNQLDEPNGGGLWRKNRVDNGDGSLGVDLNRNYPFEWGHDNSGSSPSSFEITYRGPSPASELETQHMLALMTERDFVTAISAHSASNVWIRPWGYDSGAPLPNQAAYDEIGGLAAPPGWPVGTGVATLGYPANGVTNDTDQGTFGTLSWTPEIGTVFDSFWPDPSRIVPLAEEVLPGIRDTVAAAGAWPRVLAVVQGEAGDGDGFVEPGESATFVVDLRNSGLAATSTPVELTVVTTSPWVAAPSDTLVLPALASFSDADNAGQPLVLDVLAGAPAGAVIDAVVSVTTEGFTQETQATLIVGRPRPFVVDDVEVDLGWTAGLAGDTASTGLWERADPVETSTSGQIAQPGDDHTPGAGTQAFVTGNGGGSAGNDDVDDGFTTLVSPRFDLSGVGAARLSYARWFADLSNADDVFEVSISNDDGQSWVSLETVAGNANSWVEPTFVVGDVLPPTDAMRLRFVASDDPNNSVVDALVDDLRIEVYDAAPRINLYGDPGPGDDLRFGVAAESGSPYTWYYSAGTADLQVGLIQGHLLLDPATLFALFSGQVPVGDLAAVDVPMTYDPGLSGFVVYLQAFVNQAGSKHLTNRVQVTLP